MSESDATPERSFGTVVRDIGGNVDRIVRAELRFAMAQLRVEMGATANASRIIAAGAACAMLAVGFALLGGMFALSLVMPTWLASMTVAAGAAAAAALLIAVGRTRFARQRTPALGDFVSRSEENA
jgi:hypothetical protein